MDKKSKKNKYIEKEFEQNLTDPGDLPENVLGILALLGTAANIMIKETDLAAFSGRAGEFMFTLVYDPFEKIDEENYKSAIKDIIKKVDPSYQSLEFNSNIEEVNDKEEK